METIASDKGAVRVLYEDNHLIVAVKPFNMLSQSDDTGDADMLSCLKGYIARKYEKTGNVFLGLVHRLDRPAGGVMVFARTSKAASRLSAQFASHMQGRRYLAVAEGEIPSPMQLTGFLRKDGDGFVRAYPPGTPGAREARLTTSPAAFRDGLTLTDVELYTGRAHQIRVQHANAGHPLYGDARYGNGSPGKQLALWAWKLSFEHPTRRETVSFTCLPPDTYPWTLFAPELERISQER